MIRLPETVRVGPYLYEVNRESAKRLQGSNADCDRNYLVMGIDPTLPDTKQVAELFHEITHAIADLINGPTQDIDEQPIPHPKWDEEQVANLFSPLWLMVLLDNPSLIDLLDESRGVRD